MCEMLATITGHFIRSQFSSMEVDLVVVEITFWPSFRSTSRSFFFFLFQLNYILHLYFDTDLAVALHIPSNEEEEKKNASQNSIYISSGILLFIQIYLSISFVLNGNEHHFFGLLFYYKWVSRVWSYICILYMSNVYCIWCTVRAYLFVFSIFIYFHLCSFLFSILFRQNFICRWNSILFFLYFSLYFVQWWLCVRMHSLLAFVSLYSWHHFILKVEI